MLRLCVFLGGVRRSSGRMMWLKQLNECEGGMRASGANRKRCVTDLLTCQGCQIEIRRTDQDIFIKHVGAVR